MSQPSPKTPTPSFGGGSHLGVPCRGALVGRAEWEGEKRSINIQKASEYLEGGNQVSPTSLQGMKALSLQSLFLGEVPNASYRPCSLSLNSL